ncbi:nitrogen fixation protein FixH [Thioalkalivibrio denitrificans]|uniref:Nitrogen fixation protein FixH n=1 Tax=Thioalkalivibrio denitrificans TaxID=108003 RepID=A0A1V3NCV0_9GAMM|nr:FixH family protein [Thioalkalivibrio denitrificans]OOG22890.1 nitrogen fixation protein FixH [Thioalkalivibrio denitrificans]
MRYVREDSGPWYRQPWPWLLMIPPVTAVFVGMALLRAATWEPDGLVVADYYQEGRAINEVLERERFAASLGLAGEVRFDGRHFILQMEGTPLPGAPLTLRLLHPTRANKDAELTLIHDEARNVWQASVSDLPDARWHLHLEPQDRSWRLRGRLEPGERIARVAAQG